MKRYLSMLFAVLIAVAAISCGGKQTKTSEPQNNDMVGEAEGYAQIFDNDNSLARDRAIDDAMNKLVKMKLGTMVSGSSLVRDFQLVESIVEAKSTGMVRNWTILKEGPSEGSFIVRLRGEVYPQAVNDTIKSTLENYGRPKFMVLVDEKIEGAQNTPGMTFAELTIMNVMGNAGFEFVDSATTQELIKKDKEKMAQAMKGQVGGDVQGLLLDDAGAEVIIYGSVTTADQSGVLKQYGNVNMKSKQAIVSLKAVDVYTGRILATVSSNAPAAHIDATTASKNAIQSCLARKSVLGSNNDMTGQFESGDFINQITYKFLESATRRLITINIVGLDSNGLTKFRNNIQNRVRGVSKVYLRGQAGKESKIEIEFAGKVTDFTDELKAKSEALGFNIEIKETFPNKVFIKADAI